MLIKIQPVRLNPSFEKSPLMADYAQVSVASVTMGVGASGNVLLGTVDDADEFKAFGGYGATVALTPEQYANWGTDDDYAARCFVENYGLKIA